MTTLYGLDQWLEEPYQRAYADSEGDVIEQDTAETVAACSECGKPCAHVEIVRMVAALDEDEFSGRTRMVQVEEREDSERTSVANPTAPKSAWRCVVCAGFCDEGDIVRPVAA